MIIKSMFEETYGVEQDDIAFKHAYKCSIVLYNSICRDHKNGIKEFEYIFAMFAMAIRLSYGNAAKIMHELKIMVDRTYKT